MGAQEELRDLLENQPLYARARVGQLFFGLRGTFPDKIELLCPQCGMSRPFTSMAAQRGSGSAPSIADSIGVHSLTYRCNGCDQVKAWFFLEVTSEQVTSDHLNVWKVGQTPPWSINIPGDLADVLGEDKELYKRALICLSQSYGVGASAYLRRILENHITPVLQLIHEARQQEGASAAELDKITAAIKGKVFETKTEIAYRHAPKSIIVDGINPLKYIHDQLSAGIHRLNEEDSTAVAVKLKAALEFVVRELRGQIDSGKVFAQEMKKTTTTRATSKKTP